MTQKVLSPEPTVGTSPPVLLATLDGSPPHDINGAPTNLFTNPVSRTSRGKIQTHLERATPYDSRARKLLARYSSLRHRVVFGSPLLAVRLECMLR